MELGKKISEGWFYIDYLGGHPAKTEKCDCRIHVYENALQIDFIKTWQDTMLIDLPLNEIVACNIETKEQVEKRVTATRMLAFGLYAFAMKKKEKTETKYLTIQFKNEQDIECIAVFSGAACSDAHSLIYKVMTAYRKIHPLVNSQKSTEFAPYEELKKLKELLDLEIITQEEFDIKKKELLNL